MQNYFSEILDSFMDPEGFEPSHPLDLNWSEAKCAIRYATGPYESYINSVYIICIFKSKSS